MEIVIVGGGGGVRLYPFHCFSYFKHLTVVFTNVIPSRFRWTSQYQQA